MTTAEVELLYPKGYYEAVPKPRTAAKGALAAELSSLRDSMVKRMRLELKKPTEITLADAAGLAWRAYVPVFLRRASPLILAEFHRGMRQARKDVVPEKILVPLAEQYAEKMGEYFNQSSTEAMLEGYNAYVNKKVPQKAAAERALDHYGLTRRQTRSVVAATSLEPQAVASVANLDVKRKVRSFIGQALRDRFKLFEEEELFRANQHARQLVWLYEHKNNRLPPGTRRIWITADDEKVCPQCGPLHNMRAPIDEPFHTGQGDVWTPGLHVNCRCEVRLWVPTVTLIGKADDWDAADEKVHPRDAQGRWSRKRGSSVTHAEPDPFLKERIETAFRQPAPERAPTRAPQREEPIARTSAPERQGPPKREAAPTRTPTRDTAAPKREGISRVFEAPERVKLIAPTRAEARIVHSREMSDARARQDALIRQFEADAVRAGLPKPEVEYSHQVHALPVPMGIAEMMDDNYPIADWDSDNKGNKFVTFVRSVSISDMDEILTDHAAEQAGVAYEEDEYESLWNKPIDFTLKLPSVFGPYAKFHVDEQLDDEQLEQIRDVRQQIQKMVDKEEAGWHVDWLRTTFTIPGVVEGSESGLLDGNQSVPDLTAGWLLSAFDLSPTTAASPPEQFIYVFHAISGNVEDIEQETGSKYSFNRAVVKKGHRYRVTGERRAGEYHYIYLRPDE